MKNVTGTKFLPLLAYCLVSWEGVAFAPLLRRSPLAFQLYASGPDENRPKCYVGKDDEDSTERTPSLAKKNVGTTSIAFQLQTGFWYTFAGITLLGVVFNLFGYAFTFEDGSLRFDTLREIRMERLLDEESSSSGSTGLSEFFFKNPFTASLLLTGIVLVYENVVYGGRKKK